LTGDRPAAGAACEHHHVLRRANFLSDSFRYDASDPDGYRAGQIRVSKEIGAQTLAVKVFELPAGQSVCPYHY
jgi:hypothetical protein